jgi:hypothetical protein
MIKSIVMHDIDMDHVAAMERWYYKDHAPEINRRFGPWLTRHESFLPVDAPAVAREFGFFNWRVTEGWWRELPETGPKGNFAFTLPPVWPKVATCFVPAQPEDDFLGGELQPASKQVLRWYILFRYPAGVKKQDGEKWFLETHVPQVIKQKGLYRFFSYRVINKPLPLPGAWPPNAAPPPDSILHSWDRVYELWFETFADWETSVITSPPAYTQPTWATRETYPFVVPGEDFVSSFILERPNDEFWRDSRGYL